ncbi:prenyltransferase/squalene oxidase repeat-containing protein [Aliiroseovarius sp. F20344]|uniref:prenyltransferase/squalene oxidase repeat-containing protein n=1 Tax=Aliiroseovarius sp. F20344 TaxID=2926414 RepID=UPI001FF40721|nr:prenyltransferase/squalene oxidase repeat-containing protein [Aliiroseovarius sp. F20344]MCK0141736.1 hypothetical protein [Aliiroseovarius sp. F20344]
MDQGDIIKWLMAGDPAIAYQTSRDLLGEDRFKMRHAMLKGGQVERLLALRGTDGGWGDGYYRPRWACTHYILLELKEMGLVALPEIAALLNQVACTHMAGEGGLGHAPGVAKADVCINGMFLNFGCAFGLEETHAAEVLDWLLSQQMFDGGWNCRKNRSGAVHSSLHSTLSIVEGLHEYICAGHSYRVAEARAAAEAGREFILQHRFYRSDRTGRIIKSEFLRFPYPPRWRYNVLRALDHFRNAGCAYDPRMKDALDVIASKRRADGRWPIYASQKGDTLGPEKGPGPSYWVTLLALRVLKIYPRA